MNVFDNNNSISIISPVFNNQNTLSEIVRRAFLVTEKYFSKVDYYLVDDGSTDKSKSIIKKLCLSDDRIKGIFLTRNFGQHNALMAGLNECSSDLVLFELIFVNQLTTFCCALPPPRA